MPEPNHAAILRVGGHADNPEVTGPSLPDLNILFQPFFD
jgi:hypothetical protein